MQIVLFTLLALTGADASHASANHAHSATVSSAGACAAADCQGCGTGLSHAERRAVKRAEHAAEHERQHMMPQTCYAPRHGCYYSGDRHMHRYPAFHGTFYRRPYNYRNVFDYPWHAELHEPTSLFSYGVETAAAATPVVDAQRMDPPAPPVDAGSKRGTRVYVGDDLSTTSRTPVSRHSR
ncbi:MAG: hypothetical protein J5I93_16805 [Pirellulaceae bacterium]|nr:hypothetical protein [Pirellulaceae bacterium]